MRERRLHGACSVVLGMCLAAVGCNDASPRIRAVPPLQRERAPCVEGAKSPKAESQLSLVHQDPYSSSADTAQRYNLAYPHRQGELLVFPRRRGTPPETEQAKWSSLWTSVGAEVLRFDGVVPMYQIRLPLTSILDQVADHLVRDGDDLIESIEANSCVFPQQNGVSDPEAGKQWGHWRIGLEQAWSITTGLSSVVVAVMDSGINHQNPDLACNFWDNPCDISNGVDDSCVGDPAD